jgi:hypothetical protein
VKKHLETLFKGFSSPKSELSAVPPDQYADRFVKFIRRNVNPKDNIPYCNNKKEDLSQSAIPKEFPMTTPSAEQREKSPSIEDVDIVRTVVSPPDRSDQKLPAIRVQHPSPEIREEGFEREMVNGIGTPLVNGD